MVKGFPRIDEDGPNPLADKPLNIDSAKANYTWLMFRNLTLSYSSLEALSFTMYP